MTTGGARAQKLLNYTPAGMFSSARHQTEPYSCASHRSYAAPFHGEYDREEMGRVLHNGVLLI